VRRDLLGWLGAGVGLLASGASAGAAAATPASAPLGPAVRVTRGRLDALAEEFFPAFNQGAVVTPFSAARHAARFDVDLRRLTTVTRVPETGERVTVSGLLAVPAGARGRIPLVSWQHGTILSFDQVPSNLVRLGDPAYRVSDEGDSLETLFNLQRLAGQGFAVVAADYLGKGSLRHGRGEAYAVREATVATCCDLLDAGRHGLGQLGLTPSALFLNGWSQGGLNTQWVHQALRRRGVAITASAAQSPFNNLVEALRYWTGQLPLADRDTYPAVPGWAALCLIVVLGSYREYYTLPDLFRTAIKPRHLAFAEKYWQSYQVNGTDLAQAPASAADLLVDGFLERFTALANSRFLVRAGENTSAFYTYDAPFRFYYGLADEALHPSMMQIALAAAGPQAGAIAVPGASHRATFLASLYGDGALLGGLGNVPDWFRAFL
jgi:hypothetical protein